MRYILVLVLVATAGAATGLIVSASARETDDPGGAVNAAAAAGCPPVDFDHYTAGSAVDGHAKMETVRKCEDNAGAPTRMNMVMTLYGYCDPNGADMGCAPPVQVQSWPACERNLALYKKYPGPDGQTPEYVETTIRGVPAAIFEEGRRIEVYTGDATVVIFAENRGLARAAAARLSGRHGERSVTAEQDLPAPDPGALAGKAAC